MKISHRNFMASQAFYGLSIAPRIPSRAKLRKLVALSYEVADMQIAFARKAKKK